MYVKVSRGFRPSCENRGASALRGFCPSGLCPTTIIIMYVHICSRMNLQYARVMAVQRCVYVGHVELIMLKGSRGNINNFKTVFLQSICYVNLKYVFPNQTPLIVNLVMQATDFVK